MRAIVAAAAVAIGAVLLACASQTRQSGREDFALNGSSRAALRVFATGDLRGYLETCGCEHGQVGGLARRLTYRDGTRRPGDLWIDLGNLSQGIGEQRRIRRDAILDGHALVGYDAVVPGRVEVLEGASFADAAKARGVPVVCANAVDAGGALVFPPYVLRDLPDGRRVAVVGICDEIAGDAAVAAVGAAVRRTLPPAGALRSTLLDLEGKADVVIAATSLPVEAAKKLARDVPGVALVLAGVTPEAKDVTFDASAPALVGVAGHLGEYVARIDFGKDLRPATTWRAWLAEDLAEDPRGTAIVHAYKAAVAALDAQYAEKLVAAKRAEGFAGSTSCAPCHRPAFDTWKASLHGNAMKILVERKSQRDPDCVPCHLVDVPASAAGEPFDPDAMGVGCEACHGPSAAHAAAPETKTPVRDGGRSLCASKCHHPPEVKNFDFETQWPRIRHSGK